MNGRTAAGTERDNRKSALVDRLVVDPNGVLDELRREVALGHVAVDHAMFDILAPVLAEAEQRWGRPGWTDAHEDAVLASVERALAVLAHDDSPTADKGTVALACPPGEWHQFPARLLAAALRRHGWLPLQLGPSAGPRRFREFLERSSPDALLLSCTMAANLAGAGRLVAMAHEGGVPVFVGGRAFGHDRGRALAVGADGWASSGKAAPWLLETWAAPVRQTPVPLPAAAEFGLRRGGLVHAWRARIHLDRVAEDRCLDWLVEWVPVLVDGIESSLLVDDDMVFLDDVEWLAGAVHARFPDAGSAVVRALEGLQRLLPVDDVALHRLVDEATARARGGAPSDRADGVHPSPPSVDREDERLAVLRAHPALRRGREPQYDDLAFLAATACDAPLALVTLVEGDRLVVKGAYGTEVRFVPRDRAMAAWALVSDDVVVVPDATRDPRFEALPHVVGPPGIRLWAGVSLRTADGLPLGVLGVADRTPRELSPSQHLVLRSLARHAELLLGLRSAEMGRSPAWKTGSDVIAAAGDDLRRMLAGSRGTCLSAGDLLLRTAEVARLFQVSPRTVTNWAAEGRLRTVRTAGGHHRYPVDSVLALLETSRSGPAPGEETA